MTSDDPNARAAFAHSHSRAMARANARVTSSARVTRRARDERSNVGRARERGRDARARADARENANASAIDDALSARFIALDPAGYFVIRAHAGAIEARHYKNVIGADGLARDPSTRAVIPCDGSYKGEVNAEFTGRTAKEISVKIFERDGEDDNGGLCSMISHANYLGREFQRAEWCLRQGVAYVQD